MLGTCRSVDVAMAGRRRRAQIALGHVREFEELETTTILRKYQTHNQWKYGNIELKENTSTSIRGTDHLAVSEMAALGSTSAVSPWASSPPKGTPTAMDWGSASSFDRASRPLLGVGLRPDPIEIGCGALPRVGRRLDPWLMATHSPSVPLV